MKTLDRIRITLNDGVLRYGYQETLLSEKKKVIGKKFVEEGKLFFKELYARDSDYQICNSIGSKLERKVQTLLARHSQINVLTNKTISIDGDLFEVIRADQDKNYLYLYLSRVGEHADG